MTDRSAPGVRIESLPHERARAGTPLDLAGRIISVRYQDHDERVDVCTLELDNFDLALFDREDLGAGAILSVSWGYPGRMTLPRRVVVRHIKGFSRLLLECHATSVLFDRVSRTRRFEQARASDVAREIARELGYSDDMLDIEPSRAERHDVLVQAAETDARFLARLAAREGFVFRAEPERFTWRPVRREEAPTHVFTYYVDPGRGDVLEVSSECDLARRVGSEVVRGRDPRTRTTIEARATNETTERTTLAEVVEVIDPETGRSALEERRATESVRSTTAATHETASHEAQARFVRAEQRSVRLRVRVVGDPTLGARRIIEMRGISALLSGRYYVRSVTHIVSGEGYTSELELWRDGVGRRARSLARELRGTPNTTPGAESQAARATGAPPPALRAIERVDPETGRSAVEYRGEEVAAS
jgi:hypothetical protein